MRVRIKPICGSALDNNSGKNETNFYERRLPTPATFLSQVHINLGAGENEMASARGLTLNDLSWHEVNLTRREANISLQIDVIHTTRAQLPGRFFELNIHYGVFIGGRGDFNELFLGKTRLGESEGGSGAHPDKLSRHVTELLGCSESNFVFPRENEIRVFHI